MADTTWGGRVESARQMSSARKWKEAEARFDSLHHQRPGDIDAVIGLGVVARGEGRYSVARRHFREALAIDSTSENAQELLDDTEWDRPLTLQLDAGSTRAQGVVTSTWGADAIVPLNPKLSLTSRFAIIGGGDAFRGIFLHSDSSHNIRQYVGSLGAIVKPNENLTITAAGERWSGSNDTSQTFAWFDAELKASDRIVLHATARPIAGGDGEPQFGGAVDYTLRRAQVLSLEISQGIRQAEFDARTIVRGSFQVDPSRSVTYGVDLVRDIDRRFSATTGVGTFTWYARPTFGVRTELSDREGKFAQRSATAGVVLRW